MRFLKIVLYACIVLVAVFWASSWYFMGDAGEHEYAGVSEKQRKEAEAYLAAGLPDMPQGWEWSTFSPAGGIELRAGTAAAKGDSKGTVLLIPGYTAMLELYGDTLSYFQNAGYDVAAIEYRGQGLSTRELDNPEKGYVKSYATLTKDLAAFAEKLKSDGAEKLYVFAESMGGHLALRMAGERQPDVEAYFLQVPMIQIETGDFPYGVARALGAFYSWTGLGENFAPGQGPFVPGREKLGTPSPCMDNAKTAQLRDALYIRDERYRVVGTTNYWVDRTMNSSDLIKSPGFIQQINKPVAMVTAGDDKWVNSDVAKQVCDRLKSCTNTHYEESRHCISREKPETAQEIYGRAEALFEAN